MALRPFWQTALVGSLLGGCAAGRAAAPAQPPQAPTERPGLARNIPVEGIGFVTGLVVHPDFRRAPQLWYARTDVGGLYRLDVASDRWIPLLDATPLAHMRRFQVESVALDPAEPQHVYIAAGDRVWFSADRGSTWSDTGLVGVETGHASSRFRGASGERLAIDPARPGRLFFGSRTRGLWLREPGAGWIRVDGGLPVASDPGHTFVRFAPSRVYTGVFGSGVWASEDGGTTWKQAGDDPRPLRADVAPDGTLFVSFGGHEYAREGAVRRLRDGAWTDITPHGVNASWTGISVHHRGTLVVTSNLGLMFRSTDAGVTWAPVPLRVVNRPPYSWTEGGWGSAALVLDPGDPDGRTALRSDGFLVARTRDVARLPFHPVMRGLEELVAFVIRAPPRDDGPRVLSGVGDAVGFAHEDLDQVPARRHVQAANVAMVTGLDVCARSPRHVALVGHDEVTHQPLTGLSDDGGRSFRPFGDTSPGRGGVVAISATDPRLLLWAPQNEFPRGEAHVFRSADGGGRWEPVRGLPGPSFYRQSAWWNGQTLAADRMDGRVFYVLHQDPAGVVRLFRSDDGGAGFTQAGPPLAGAPAWNVRPMVKPNPFVSRDLIVSFSYRADAAPRPLYRSRDGGVTFATVPGLPRAFDVAWGAGARGDRPYLWAHGSSAGEADEGLWRSSDDGRTWTLRTDPDRQRFALLTYLEADLRVPDRVYVATAGRGLFLLPDPHITSP